MEDFESRIGGQFPGMGTCKFAKKDVLTFSIFNINCSQPEETTTRAIFQDGSRLTAEAAGSTPQGGTRAQIVRLHLFLLVR